ncbi:hypothetical protein QTP88_011481 [Uroleucon formosanum]
MAGIRFIDRNSESNGSNSHRQKNNINAYYRVKLFDGLLLHRRNEEYCDLRLQTDDGTIIATHKIVLAAGCPYFYSMFKGFKENNKSLINIREVDTTSLQLLIDYIYTGEIMISDQNVLDLMPAASMLQLDSVKDACVKFLQDDLNPSNCLGIRKFANFYDDRELLRSSEEYIKKYFREVVEEKEFLSLTSKEVIELISHDNINVPFEEIVFECVYKWVKYEFSCRYDSLPALMEHVRLPLVPIEYLLTNVLEDPLFKKCYYYVTEAINYHKMKENVDFSNSAIRITPRKSYALQKVILVMSLPSEINGMLVTHWYYPTINVWQSAPKIQNCHRLSILTVVKNQYIFSLGREGTPIQVLDFTSQSSNWKLIPDMLVDRVDYGVGVLDNCIYVIGGFNDSGILSSVELFDITTQEWRMISDMSHIREFLGVGVLNNLVYTVGGFTGTSVLRSVEYYNPSLDIWTEVATMSTCRMGASVAVLDGKLYAVGGYDLIDILKCAESYEPSAGVWTSIADMHLPRFCAGVFALDGFLHVLGGKNRSGTLNSKEIYNPKTNTWSLEVLPNSDITICNGLVVEMVPNFKINPWKHSQSL